MFEKPYPVTRRTFWTFWRRGVLTMFNAGVAIAVPWALLVGGLDIVDQMMQRMPTPWSTIFGVGSALVLVAAWFIVAPVHCARWPIEAISMRPQVAAELESDVDAVAASLGVQWEEEYVSQIERFLDSDELQEARKFYHDATERTWDEVNAGLKEWPADRLREKLAILRTKCAEFVSESPMTPRKLQVLKT